MRRNFVLGSVLVLVLVAAQGCLVTSVHPLYRSEDDIIFDEGLVGRWVADDGDFWEFTEYDEPGQSEDDDVQYYLIVVTDDGKPTGILEGRLVGIGDYRFLDLAPYDFESSTFAGIQKTMEDAAGNYPHGFEFTPGDTATNSDLGLWVNNALLFPTHTVLQVRRNGDTLRVAFMDYEWVSNQAEAGTLDVAHEIENDLLLITASSGDLRNFVRRYADDANVFELDELHRE